MNILSSLQHKCLYFTLEKGVKYKKKEEGDLSKLREIFMDRNRLDSKHPSLKRVNVISTIHD